MPSETSQSEESQWWYLIAAVPVGYVFPLLIFPLVFVGFMLDGGPALVGVGLFMFAMFVALVVSVILPIALYKDIELLPADVDWTPDRDLYVLVSIVGIFVQGVGAAVALYYLYKRHVHVGAP